MTTITTPVLLHDWAGVEPMNVLLAFCDASVTWEEMQAPKSPYANADYWRENVAKGREFLAQPDMQNVDLLLASYTNEHYSGDAFVLFRKDGTLYEVNGCHCSCYGLEGQWSPEATTVAALRARLAAGRMGRDTYPDRNVYADELTAVLSAIDPQPESTP